MVLVGGLSNYDTETGEWKTKTPHYFENWFNGEGCSKRLGRLVA